MKVGSLCTGYGGLDLAVDNVLGTTLEWVCEFDQHAAKVCDARFPDVPNLHDLTTVDWKGINTMAAHRNDELAQAMFDRYCQGLSCEQVAQEFGRTRQTVWQMFNRRGWDLRSRPPARPSVEWMGRTFSLRNNGYYGATDGGRESLHRLVWEHHNRPLLPDEDVHHIDHDKLNNDPDNLRVMTKAEHAALHGRKEVMPNEEPAVDVLTAGYP